MELIVISNPFAIPDEANLISKLFHADLKCFHLRKPESELQRLRDLLKDIDSRFYERIALHQYHDMAEEFGIKRLHYTGSSRSTSCLKTIRNQGAEGFTLSTSIHEITSLPEIRHFDYAFYGPVFNSISKAGYQSKVSENVRLNKADCETKIIALGGVQACNLTRIKRMGFDGAAVLGALWNEPHKAVQRFNQLKEQLII